MLSTWGGKGGCKKLFSDKGGSGNQFQVDSSDKVSFSYVFQLENLKRYPFVAFPKTGKFACEMNVSLDQNSVILKIIKGILTCPTKRILIAKGKTAVSISENN